MTMKKNKSLFATIAMLMCCISVYADEYVKIGDLWYDIIYNDRVAKVISWQDDSKYSGDIVIPKTVEYNGEIYGVTSIGYDAFRYCSSLTSVTIPDGVTSISEYAFQDCSGLTTLTIPSSVTTIASTAFYSCSGLTTIIVDPDNKVYDSRNNCNAIIESASNTLVIGCKTTSIPKSVTSIGDCAFIGCSNLYSISIPNSVISIGGWAFNGSGLYFITIPSSVTSIGKYVFCYCHNLKNITVDTENEVYDSRNNCNAIIKTATNTLISGCNTTSIPNNVTSIDDGAFAGLSGMNSIEIPNSVTNIGYGAFKDNMNLTSINIPKSITSIGEYAFDGCI